MKFKRVSEEKVFDIKTHDIEVNAHENEFKICVADGSGPFRIYDLNSQTKDLETIKIKQKYKEPMVPIYDKKNKEWICFGKEIASIYSFRNDKHNVAECDKTSSASLGKNVPSILEQYQLVYDTPRDCILFVGGKVKNEPTNTIYCLNKSRNKIEELKCSNRPSPRYAPSVAIDENKLYIFGGKNKELFNDLWCLDLETRIYQEIKLHGDFLAGRHRAGMVVFNHTYLFILGGRKDGKHLYVINIPMGHIMKHVLDNNKGFDVSKIFLSTSTLYSRYIQAEEPRDERMLRMMDNTQLNEQSLQQLVVFNRSTKTKWTVNFYNFSNLLEGSTLKIYRQGLENRALSDFGYPTKEAMNQKQIKLSHKKNLSTKQEIPPILGHHDINICINGKIHALHRAILAQNSIYFDILLRSYVHEGKKDGKNLRTVHMTIQSDKDNSLFPFIILYIYRGFVTVPPSKLIPLYLVAQELSIVTLLPLLLNAIKVDLDIHSLNNYYEQSVTHQLFDIKKLCLSFIAHHIEEADMMIKDCFNDLSIDEVCAFCKENKLNKSFQRIVSELVLIYIEHHSFDKKEIERLILSVVSFEYMEMSIFLSFLKMANHMALDSTISKKFMDHVASNIDAIADDQALFNQFNIVINFENMCALLQSPNLIVINEDQLMDNIEKYMEKHPQLSEAQKIELYHLIVYPALSFDRLKEIKAKLPTIYMTQDDFKLCLLSRIGLSEQMDLKDLPVHFKPRSHTGFLYQSDFDTNGILYWLGTNKKTAFYKNPFLLKTVEVTASQKLEEGSMQDVISHTPTKCNFVNGASQHCTIHFKTISVSPTAYTLRHTLTRQTEILRTWDLEGSHDNRNWTTLKSHSNDNSITTKGGTHTWMIQAGGMFYDYFRISLKGPDSNNTHYMSIAGVEFYGHIRTRT